jgi:hypothetical protein
VGPCFKTHKDKTSKKSIALKTEPPKMEKQNIHEATEHKKQNSMLHLKIYNKPDILSLTKVRRFETKLEFR